MLRAIFAVTANVLELVGMAESLAVLSFLAALAILEACSFPDVT